MVEKLNTIVIIGLGLVGASLAAALAHTEEETIVVGVDTDDASRKVALEKKWVAKTYAPSDKDFETCIKTEADLVVLATPVGVMNEYFKQLALWDYRGIITDTASTKEHIAEVAQSLLKYPENYIPGHPMAGSEISGIGGARADLFQGAHWIVCPDSHTVAEHYQQLHELVTGVGARVVSLSRHDHDQAVAIVSHVPHIVASSLIELAARHADDQQMLFKLAAGGFKDSTRIAAGSAQLWTGISFDNSAALQQGLEEMRGIIGQFEKALVDDQKDEFKDLLQDAAKVRRSLPFNLVPDTEKLLEVRIPMSDRTGVIAEVTGIASQAGCNIQSIDIDHITSDSAVLSLILTDEGNIGHLSAGLIDSGYSVSFNPLSGKKDGHVN